MPRALPLGLLLLGLTGPARAQDSQPRTPHEMHQLHRDSAAYVAMLEDPARDAYQKPRETVAALGLKAGEVLADVGAGSGYFAVRLAEAVGPTGRVYAVDVSPDMVIYMNRRIGLSN